MHKQLLTFILACLMGALLLTTACSEDDNGGSGSGDTSGSTSGTSGSDGTSGGTSGGDTSGSTSGDTSGAVVINCEEIPTEANLGNNCAQPSDCTASACLAETQGGQGICRQPCIVGACDDMCQGEEACLPLAGQDGKPIKYPGTDDKFLGACLIPPDVQCTDIPASTTLGATCSQTNNACDQGSLCAAAPGATEGQCVQLCIPSTCVEMCNGKACQDTGQKLPDGSPIGFCQP